MNDPGMFFLAAVVKFLAVMLLVGWIPASIAKSKGRKFIPWWFYGGGFFIIALIHSLCIKSSVCEPTESQESTTITPMRSSGTLTWECDCGEINLKMAKICRICNADKVNIFDNNNVKVVGNVTQS